MGTPAPGLCQDAPAIVIFEAGLGDGAALWRETIGKLDSNVSTFAYSRPGYDGTPSTKAPRDPCTIALELHSRLAAAGKAPPYLLVGHSLGGQYAYAFARQYPQEMAGLILVDATPPGHWQEMRDHVPAAARLLKVVRAIMFSPTMRREFDAQDQCLDRHTQQSFPFPTQVLVKTKPAPGGGLAFYRMESELAKTWLDLTGANQLTRVEGAGHYIQRDRPDVLVEAIRQMLGQH